MLVNVDGTPRVAENCDDEPPIFDGPQFTTSRTRFNAECHLMSERRYTRCYFQLDMEAAFFFLGLV
jgi:hypothetical protein